MNRLKEKYLNEVRPKLKEEFKFKSDLAVPGIKKVVINIGSGEAKDDEGVLKGITAVLTSLSGQKPVVTRAKKSISAFKLTKGAPIGLMVTLRGEKMYVFLDKLMNIALPKVRDFRGVPGQSFDARGSYNLGLREYGIFPEVEGLNAKIHGLQVTITTSAENRDQGYKLLELLGMPFKKEAARG